MSSRGIVIVNFRNNKQLWCLMVGIPTNDVPGINNPYNRQSFPSLTTGLACGNFLFCKGLQGPIWAALVAQRRNGCCSTGLWRLVREHRIASALRGDEVMIVQINELVERFFERKFKIIVLTVLTYAALC